jgi:methylthioribulose-1-phosphate dehydratase
MSDLAQKLCSCASLLADQGWCQGTGGNFSVLLDRDPVRLLITRSGVQKRNLTRDDLMVVDGEGQAEVGQDGRPSAETRLHTTIIRLTDAASVLHTHSTWCTLLGEHFLSRGGMAITGYEMMKGLDGVTSHEQRIWVPVVANDQDMDRLGGHVAKLLTASPRPHGFVIAGHGLYTWGKTVDTARRHVEIFEFLFEVIGRRTHFEPFSGE